MKKITSQYASIFFSYALLTAFLASLCLEGAIQGCIRYLLPLINSYNIISSDLN
jgi:hypothetical protein